MRPLIQGVETKEQLEYLNTLGCECAQGYLFAKPLDAAAVATYMRSNAGAEDEALLLARYRSTESVPMAVSS